MKKRALPQSVEMKQIPVWIVDDNRNYCRVLSETLNSSASTRCEAMFHSASAVVKSFSSTLQPPAVLLLDIKMQVRSGLDIIEEVRRLSPFTYIIMLTAVDDEHQIKVALQRGAAGYLLKDSSPTDIIRAIETAVRGGTPLDPMITKKILSALIPDSKTAVSDQRLTIRQRDVVKCIVNGLTLKEIAVHLNISKYTVETHIRNIYDKLNIHNKHTLVAKVYNERLLD